MADSASEPLETPVGETSQTSIQVSSDRGASFPATVYTGVNVTEDPELRDPLLEGTLNEVESPFDDGRVYRPAIPVTYHDEEIELFALVIPEALRHEEFQCRKQLLERLAAHDEVVPAYMRDFEVVFNPLELEELERRYAGTESGEDAGESTGEETAELERRLRDKDDEIERLEDRIEQLDDQADDRDELEERLEERTAELEDRQDELDDLEERLEERTAELEDRRDELDDLEERLEEERERRRQLEDEAREADEHRTEEIEQRARELDERAEELDEREYQLEEVADRVERDSARVDEARRELEQERSELEHHRQKLEDWERKLQVRELNLEQQELEQESGQGPPDQEESRESTQVVTDDQFVEVVEADEPDEGLGAESSELGAESSRPAGPPGSSRPEPAKATVMTYDPDDFYEDFDEVADDDRDWFVEPTDDLVVVGYRLDDDRAEMFLEGEPAFLFQLHEVDGVPLVSLTLAAFDDEGECLEAVGAPLTDTGDQQQILDDIAQTLHVHLAIYDEDGGRVTAWEAGAPIRRNIGWARRRLEDWRAESDDVEDRLREAVEAFGTGEDLVGSMQHPFDTNSFVDFDGASDVALAVNIVGYWSEDEQFEYLIGNRSFSLEEFRRIQKRVVRQALHWGIAPGEALREVAVEEAIIPDQPSLVERLLSNFAEVCVGLRPNDLDPIEQWENWDELIGLAEECDITPDPEVLELAEVSLNRAEEYKETMGEDEGGESASESGARSVPEVHPRIDVTSGTASRRSEQTGVGYFVPADYGEDAFDELMEADRDDVEAALADDDRCVEAAQVLVERFDDDAVGDVLAAADEMDDDRVAALARFVEARADGLEAVLMRLLEETGPDGAFVAARALAAIESTAAIPRLLEAVRDPDRSGDDGRLVRCLALFGDKLVPPLSQKLEESPDDSDLIAVLTALEEVRTGTIDELAEDRSQQLQKAADRARETA